MCHPQDGEALPSCRVSNDREKLKKDETSIKKCDNTLLDVSDNLTKRTFSLTSRENHLFDTGTSTVNFGFQAKAESMLHM
jgi:hypothetical protein